MTVPQTALVIERAQFPKLIDALRARGYRVIGPRVRDGAIGYEDIQQVEDLPIGWTDEQEAGTYRLRRRKDQALFGYTVGPQSWKPFLYPPESVLWRTERDGRAYCVVETAPTAPRQAFLGVRACELHAILTQDRIFMPAGGHADPTYRARREGAFIVAVNCSQAGSTCFCTSMHTGPEVPPGYDLALTELVELKRHYFVVMVGTPEGDEVLRQVPHRPARPEECQASASTVARTARRMGRRMSTAGLRDTLLRQYEHPQWDDVARRCLACGNCTLVCPTCFCSTVEDTTDLTGTIAERRRKWDSCFTAGFSFIHGGSIRASVRARYRQWLTHKLATWQDQFGTAGCVGCGRCITWCPVGIDLTEEVRVIRATARTVGPAIQQTGQDDGDT